MQGSSPPSQVTRRAQRHASTEAEREQSCCTGWCNQCSAAKEAEQQIQAEETCTVIGIYWLQTTFEFLVWEV